MMEIKVKVVNKSNHRLPEYQTAGSAGMDLKANTDSVIELKPLERVLIPTGLFMAIPDGFEGRIQSRSGLALKHGVIVCNTPGCIDSDYRGQVKVILANISNEPFFVNPGDRIAQLIFSPVAHADLDEVESLDETERGDGGFGSTGV